MNPDVRAALLALAIVFCLAFGGMTLTVISESGLTVLTVTSLLIIALVGLGLIGAIRNPPR
jgi:hypothetical protein